MNNDQNPPAFTPTPFPQLGPQDGIPAPPASVEQQEPKKRGGRRGPREPDKPVKRGRPKGSRKINKEIKKARTRQAATQTMAQATAADTGLRISVASAFDILRGLDVMESEALQKCILAVGGLGKKSRERVMQRFAHAWQLAV